jgi:ABC-type multidrug transport system fused ATPase/permease subunit
MLIIENFYKLFTNIYKIKKIINNKNKFFELKVIFFLNFIFFFIDLFSILSLPIFVSLLVDKNYLIQKYNIGSYFSLINYDPIVIMSILIIVLFIIKNFFYIFLIHKQASFIKEIKINISEKIFSGYLLGPYTSHLNKNPSTLTRDSTYSVQSFGFYILHSINLFREIVSITFLIALLFFIKPLIMLILLIFFMPITLFFQKKFKKLLSNKANQNSKINELLTKDVFNAFLSIKDIKILEKEFDIINKFNFKIFKYENNLYFFQALEKIPKSILEILSVFFLLIVSLVLFQITKNQVEFFTALSVFLFATLRLLPSFTSVISSLNYLKIYEPGLVTLYNENNQSFKLNHIPNKDFSKFCNKKTVSKKLIIVEKLNFSYQKNKYFLKDINLEISEGKMHCITGETGSGKSTILNLMLGLLEPLSGNIYYKDKNIKSDISNWHQALSFVSQDPYLFDDSILNNISFNVLKNNIDKKKLNKAIEISELKQTIAKFPKGLNTKVSTQSINLSGGEKQRIALARAIYKDCNIFFLDEFTNAIDNETEKKIMQNLRNLKNKTFIIISHKKSTIDQCDKIWKLENGKIY